MLDELFDEFISKVADIFDAQDVDVDPDMDVEAADIDVHDCENDFLSGVDMHPDDIGIDVNNDPYVNAVSHEMNTKSEISFTSACWEVCKASSGDPGNRLTCGYN